MKLDLSMSVTVTLVFSDEAHRHAWLVSMGIEKGDTDARRAATKLDYDRRWQSQNLVYRVGPIEIDEERHGR